ncbi:hypothetical protein L8C07_08770 [Paenibacillus sp. CMAA1739]|uniref:hypothetical protein n=1 Tax=Paenibacillus ottowii TaxID=2315729 RepID=UPI002DBF6F5E|nr:hypothetical protein [Paenibacillus sp. CMAA1739]MEC4566037.1 hypothetical protein [Paenibacillus sp. CMAA1739]
MITYLRCNEVSMEQDDFAARFFSPEGNSRKHSFLAMDEDQLIGLILGGIRQFDGYKTMRCGTLYAKILQRYCPIGLSRSLILVHC